MFKAQFWVRTISPFQTHPPNQGTHLFLKDSSSDNLKKKVDAFVLKFTDRALDERRDIKAV
ncbi:MAG: hypothetical protein ACRDEA_11060 [Microcystaceae cyanobacterium]